MVKTSDIQPKKQFYFVNEYSHRIEKCKIECKVNNQEDYWYGKCLHSTGNRAFFPKHLYYTKQEAEFALSERHQKDINKLKEMFSTKEEMLNVLLKKYYDTLNNECYSHLKQVVEEKAEEYFGINIKNF
ncbi:MAG: hypothetical protein ACOC2W_01980 [bacterium]